MPISFTQAIQALLAGQALSWPKFASQKGGSVQLTSAGQRRLLKYLLFQDSAKVASADEAIFPGLLKAWRDNATDPAAAAAAPTADAEPATWRW